MKKTLSCRAVFSGLLSASLLATVPLSAQATDKDWPSKPIRIIVAFAPGGLTDIIARTFQPSLMETFGQPVIIENKPAAGGTVAEAQLAGSEPDGYTLLMTADGVPANPHLHSHLNYDTLTDLLPVSQLVRIPLVMLVNQQVPVKTVGELVDYARQSPGRYSYASPGTGTSNHLYFEVFKDMAKFDMIHAPYKGGSPAMNDLMGGHVQALLISGTLAVPQAKGGKVKALAVTSSERLADLPDVPTFSESGYAEFAPHQWTGLYVPKDTPQPLVERIYDAFAKAANDPDVQKRLKELNAEPIMTRPDEFKRFMADTHGLMGNLIRTKQITK